MEDQYFIKRRGEVRGPVTLQRLVEAAGRGRLSPFDLVSTDRRTWTRADQFPGLFGPQPGHSPLPSEPPTGSELGSPDSGGPSDPPAAVDDDLSRPSDSEHATSASVSDGVPRPIPSPRSTRALRDASLEVSNTWLGVCGGVGILALAHVPVRTNGGWEFYWDRFADLSIDHKLFNILSLIVGVALVFVSPFTTGVVRGAVLLGLGLVYAIFDAVSMAEFSLAVLTSVLPLTGGALVTGALWRTWSVGAGARAMSTAAGALLCVHAISWLIVLLAQINGPVVGYAAVGVGVGSIGTVLLAGAGVLGIVGVGPKFPRAASVTATVLVHVGSCLALATLAIALLGTLADLGADVSGLVPASVAIVVRRGIELALIGYGCAELIRALTPHSSRSEEVPS